MNKHKKTLIVSEAQNRLALEKRDQLRDFNAN